MMLVGGLVGLVVLILALKWWAERALERDRQRAAEEFEFFHHDDRGGDPL